MRDLCESAKKGKRCIDDLCRGASETLCGFDEEWYHDIIGDEHAPDDPEHFDDEEPGA